MSFRRADAAFNCLKNVPFHFLTFQKQTGRSAPCFRAIRSHITSARNWFAVTHFGVSE
jgi:hypothetical protein